MTPRSLLASADEVKAFRSGAVCVRRPARARSGVWLSPEDTHGRRPYMVGDNVCIREPFAETPSGRIYRADTIEKLAWQRPDAMAIATSRYAFVVTEVRCEPVQQATGTAEGIVGTRFWEPSKLSGEEWTDDAYFWAHYPKLAYARWWDSMWSAAGIPWNTNPMTWVISFQGRES